MMSLKTLGIVSLGKKRLGRHIGWLQIFEWKKNETFSVWLQKSELEIVVEVAKV